MIRAHRGQDCLEAFAKYLFSNLGRISINCHVKLIWAALVVFDFLGLEFASAQTKGIMKLLRFDRCDTKVSQKLEFKSKILCISVERNTFTPLILTQSKLESLEIKVIDVFETGIHLNYLKI